MSDDTLQDGPARLSELDQLGKTLGLLPVPAAASIKDATGRYTYANRHAQQIFGTSLQQLQGKRDAEIFPLETAQHFQENDRCAVVHRQVVQTIEELEHADGIVHESVVNRFPICDPNGEVTSVGGVAIDVTEQRQAVRALRTSEARLRAILNNTRACVLAKDLAGRYMIANKSVANLFGCGTGAGRGIRA